MLNSWLFDYDLSGCGFEFCCSHLNFSDIAPISSKEFPDIQATIRVWIHSEMHMWHDNNMHSNAPYR